MKTVGSVDAATGNAPCFIVYWLKVKLESRAGFTYMVDLLEGAAPVNQRLGNLKLRV